MGTILGAGAPTMDKTECLSYRQVGPGLVAEEQQVQRLRWEQPVSRILGQTAQGRVVGDKVGAQRPFKSL